MATLTIISGPAAGTSLEIGDEVTLGRENADLAIPDGEMSRRHAAFRLVQDGVEVEDLGSLNGTFVNGARITGRVTLTAPGRIRLGASEMEVELVAPQAPQAPAEPDVTKAREVVAPEPDVTRARPVESAQPDVTKARPVADAAPEATVARPVSPSAERTAQRQVPPAPPPAAGSSAADPPPWRRPAVIVPVLITLLVLVAIVLLLLT